MSHTFDSLHAGAMQTLEEMPAELSLAERFYPYLLGAAVSYFRLTMDAVEAAAKSGDYMAISRLVSNAREYERAVNAKVYGNPSGNTL